MRTFLWISWAAVAVVQLGWTIGCTVIWGSGYWPGIANTTESVLLAIWTVLCVLCFEDFLRGRR